MHKHSKTLGPFHWSVFLAMVGWTDGLIAKHEAMLYDLGWGLGGESTLYSTTHQKVTWIA